MALLIAIPILPPNYVARLSTVLQTAEGNQQTLYNETSICGRAGAVQSAIAMFLDHPLVGVGRENYVLYELEYISGTSLALDAEGHRRTTSTWKCWPNMGLMGLVVVGGLFVMLWRAVLEAHRRFKAAGNHSEAELAAWLGLGLVGSYGRQPVPARISTPIRSGCRWPRLWRCASCPARRPRKGVTAERSKRMAASKVTVLAYHRIAAPDQPADLSPALITSNPAAFEAQMRYVAARYHVISSWDLVRALRDGKALPSRALIITFDYGYRCFKDTALPILRRLNLPATLSCRQASPASPGRLFWWDAIHRALTRTQEPQIAVPGLGVLPLTTPAERRAAYDRLVPLVERTPEAEAGRLVESVVAQCKVEPNTVKHMLDWDELAAVAEEGVDIGPHTREHIVLAQASPERVAAEVAGSWADLQARIPWALPIFAIPPGNRTPSTAWRPTPCARPGWPAPTPWSPASMWSARPTPILLYRVGMEGSEPRSRKFAFKLTPAARAYRRVKGLVSPQAAAEFTFRQ